MQENTEHIEAKPHSGVFGHCYIYYRNDNDDDEEICLPCAKTFFKDHGYLGNCNSQYRAVEGAGGICGRCKSISVTPYWTCCFSEEKNSSCSDPTVK
jgi:hypothetical protein